MRSEIQFVIERTSRSVIEPFAIWVYYPAEKIEDWEGCDICAYVFRATPQGIEDYRKEANARGWRMPIGNECVCSCMGRIIE